MMKRCSSFLNSQLSLSLLLNCKVFCLLTLTLIYLWHQCFTTTFELMGAKNVRILADTSILEAPKIFQALVT